jgi:hypothetical protein
MADPFGNGFCLIEFIGRGYERSSLTRYRLDVQAHRGLRTLMRMNHELTNDTLSNLAIY